MRLIGYLKNEALAKTFSGYLVTIGIANLVEPEAQTWAVWIHSEDQIEAGQKALAAYQSNPADKKYQFALQTAENLERRRLREEAKAAKRIHDRDRIISQSGMAPLTLSLIGISVSAMLVLGLNPSFHDMRWLAISRLPMGLEEVRSGQVWRLITPIFVHFGVLHLFFNMLWLRDLGGMIESRQGMLKLGLMVLVLAVVSNLGQYFWSGPYFGGMSGVIYGLLGYIWLRGHCDPSSGLALSQMTVWMMLAWFFLCLFGLMGNVANVTHAVGLALGMLWGAAPMARNLFRS